MELKEERERCRDACESATSVAMSLQDAAATAERAIPVQGVPEGLPLVNISPEASEALWQENQELRVSQQKAKQVVNKFFEEQDDLRWELGRCSSLIDRLRGPGADVQAKQADMQHSMLLLYKQLRSAEAEFHAQVSKMRRRMKASQDSMWTQENTKVVQSNFAEVQRGVEGAGKAQEGGKEQFPVGDVRQFRTELDAPTRSVLHRPIDTTVDSTVSPTYILDKTTSVVNPPMLGRTPSATMLGHTPTPQTSQRPSGVNHPSGYPAPSRSLRERTLQEQSSLSHGDPFGANRPAAQATLASSTGGSDLGLPESRRRVQRTTSSLSDEYKHLVGIAKRTSGAAA